MSATSLEKIDKEILIKYKLHLKDKYSKVSTVNSKISSINAFLEFSNLQNLKIKIIKCQKSLFGNKDIQLTKGELKRLLDEAYKKKDKRIYYLMLVIARTGIRVSEVKYITVDAIRDGKAIVYNKEKVRPEIIPRKLCKFLIDYCLSHNITKDTVFITRYGHLIDKKTHISERMTLEPIENINKETYLVSGNKMHFNFDIDIIYKPAANENIKKEKLNQK